MLCQRKTPVEHPRLIISHQSHPAAHYHRGPMIMHRNGLVHQFDFRSRRLRWHGASDVFLQGKGLAGVTSDGFWWDTCGLMAGIRRCSQQSRFNRLPTSRRCLIGTAEDTNKCQLFTNHSQTKHGASAFSSAQFVGPDVSEGSPPPMVPMQHWSALSSCQFRYGFGTCAHPSPPHWYSPAWLMQVFAQHAVLPSSVVPRTPPISLWGWSRRQNESVRRHGRTAGWSGGEGTFSKVKHTPIGWKPSRQPSHGKSATSTG